MVQINFGQREVSCKLVYYGPGMSGKTTNLEIIHQKAPKESKGEMVSIATETDRTLYFDFLPLDLGQVAGMHTKFQLYTVPGQVYYNATRKLVLQGTDGVIFVADSNPDKMQENIESLNNLRENLAGMGMTLDELPFVLQYNKRDLPNAMPVAQMNEIINPMGVPAVEACARDGKGVFPTLKELSRIVIDKLNKEHAPSAQRRRTGAGMTPPQGQAAAPTPPRPAAPPPPPPPPPQPRAPAPQPPAPPPPPPPQPQAQRQAPTKPMPQQADPQSAKNRHLAKAPPKSLDQRKGEDNDVDLGPTNPHLKRFKQGKKGKGKLMVVLTIFIVIGVLVALVMFVPAVKQAVLPILPAGLQEMLTKGDKADESAAPASTPAPEPAAAPAEGAEATGDGAAE